MENKVNEIQNEQKLNEQVEVKSFEEALRTESWQSPLTDIYEDKDNYFLSVQMPGVSKGDIKITVENGNLTLMGRVNFDEKINKNFIMRETVIANYYRKFKINDSIDTEKIEAEIINGILTLTMPKHEKVKPREINIK